MTQRGFTLIEVLVAAVLVVVALLGAAAMSLTASGEVGRSGEETLAVSMAEQRFEWLRNQDFASTELAAGTTTETLAGAFAGYSRTTTVTDDTPRAGVKQIVISITAPSGLTRTITGLIRDAP